MKKTTETHPLLLNKFSVIHAADYPVGWKFISLGNSNSGEFSNGLNKDKEDYGEGSLFVNILDVFREFTIDPKKLKRVKATKDEVEQYKLEKGDLVIDRSSNIFESVGYPSYFPGYTEPVVYSGFTFRYHPQKLVWNSKFLTYQLMSSPIRKLVTSISTKSANSNVNRNSYKKIKVPCPPIREQNSLVSILRNFDKLLHYYDTYIQLTEKLKTSMLQHLLSKGIGKTSIEISRLDSILFLQRGHDLPIQKRRPGNIPVIGSNGIVGYNNEKKANGPGVIIGRSGTIGKVHYVEENYWPLNTSLYVKEFRSSFPKFIYYFLQNLDYNIFNAGTSVPTLNRNYLHPFKTKIPKNFEEQKKIANILSSIDVKISSLLSKKTHLENLKKGLMQKLLTGKIRVKI